MNKIRVVFMGTPSYATRIFEALINDRSFEVISVFTQPDKPAGRGKHLTPPDIKKFIQENSLHVKVYQPEYIKSEDIINNIKMQKPDFIVVAAYGKILPSLILDIAPCINLHASLLPKYRGASPIQYTILNADKFTGVTAMLMEQGLDSGDILGFSYIKNENLTSSELFEILSLKAANLTIKTLKNFQNILHVKQNSSQSTYAPKIIKDDGLVNFDFTCKELTQKFLAYTPWPGLFLSNGLKLKSFTCKEEKHDFKTGNIIAIEDSKIIVTCKDGFVNLQKIQPPSKQEMSASDYIKGKRMKVGDKIC